MRLTPEQIGTIRRIVKIMLPKAVSVSLFGSRVDDTRRGGDIDLYIEYPEALPFKKQARLMVALEDALDIPIDLVIRDQTSPPRPIERIAKATGVLL
ncbi:MAG: nucleotidyltransferase domain-containing protein [Sedimenticola sp.]